MTKNQKRVIAIIAIVFIAFTVIVFAVPFKNNILFWLSYVFAVISIFAQIYVLRVAFNGTDSINEKSNPPAMLGRIV
jgi:hypothetical protein